MSDLEAFCRAMDGEWIVERYELEDDRLRVCYRSIDFPAIVWSHLPTAQFEEVPPVGTRGGIGFFWGRTRK